MSDDDDYNKNEYLDLPDDPEEAFAALHRRKYCQACAGANRMLIRVGLMNKLATKPITEIRNQTLLYSVAFLLFTLPFYMTLVIAWIDRRLKGRFEWPGPRDDT